MAAEVPAQFTGYGATSPETWKDLKPLTFDPKPFEEYDIDIKIDFCGICGSDLHTLRSGWGPTMYPVVVGHEIVGKVVRVGAKVTEFKAGDVVGVGANAWSCGNCSACSRDLEQYCPDLVETYNFKYKDGSRSWGGYADYARVNERFVFAVPETLEPAIVAPMLCAGLTVYSPLACAKVGPKSRVGVVALGGLGHFAVMLAAAMGAEVTVISHSASKKEDALKMGAKTFVESKEKGWAAPLSRTLDLIICTTFQKDMPLADYISLLDVGGTLVYVGIPESALPNIPPGLMIGNNSALRGSNTGSKKEVVQMLELVAKANVKSWIEIMPMSKCTEAIEKVDRGDQRYRVVLEAGK